MKGDGYFFDLNADAAAPRRSSATAASASPSPSDALSALHLMTRAKDDNASRGALRGRGRHRSNSSSSSLPSSSIAPPSSSSFSSASSSLLHPPSSPYGVSEPPSSPPSYGFRSSDKLHVMFHSSPAKQSSERLLEDALRLCDTREYLDTMMISADLLNAKDGAVFLQLMDSLSSSKFLSSPCYGSPPAADKRRRRWDGPAWFRALGFFSFATFVASKLEALMWRRYWEAKGPRAGEESRSAAETNGLVRERLSSKEPLEGFWAALSRERREKVWAKLTAVVEAFRRRDDTDDSRSATSETSHSTHTEGDLAEWEEKQTSPSFVVSPLDGRSPSSSSERSHHSHGHPYSDINSAPISAARARGRSVSPPPTRLPRRKPSLPFPATSAFPFSPPLRQGVRQISIPSSTASIASNTSSPALSPRSSSSSVPSRAHTPPPEHQRNRSSSALSASSTTSCPTQAAGRKKTASERRKERRKTEQRERVATATTPPRLRSKTGSWDGNGFAALELWDDASSTPSTDDALFVRDHHDVQRGVEQLLRLLRALQLDSRRDAGTAAGLKEKREPTTPLINQRTFSGRAADERKEGYDGQRRQGWGDASPRRSSAGVELSSTTNTGDPSLVVELSASQPLPSSQRSPRSSELPPLFLSSSTFSKPTPTSPASVSPSVSSVLSPPSLTLTLAELQSSAPACVPLPSPSSLSSSRFIDFLFFSPLARAHTSLDLIIRRMGIAVQAVYAETMGMDLIMGEEGEEEESRALEDKRKKRALKKKKQKRRRTKDDVVKPDAQKQHSPPSNAPGTEGAADSDRHSPEQQAMKEGKEATADDAVQKESAEEEELELKHGAGGGDGESSEQSSSSGDDEGHRAEQWTEVVREERRKEEKRRQRKRMQAAARAKDDFFTSSSSSSLLSSTSPSLYSRPSAASSVQASAGLPPRSPIRAKDDIFYTDRAPRSSSASYGLTSLPLSRGVSILAGSPSPSSWAKVAYQNSARSTVSAAASSASTTSGTWSSHAQQSAGNTPSSTSASGSGSGPSSPLISSSPPLSLSPPATVTERASSVGSESTTSNADSAVAASSSTSCSSSSSSSKLLHSPPQPSPSTSAPPVQQTPCSEPSLPLTVAAQSPTSTAAGLSLWSPAIAAFVQTLTSSAVVPAVGAPACSTLPTESTRPSTSLLSSPDRKLSTAELIALHEANVRAAAAVPREWDHTQGTAVGATISSPTSSMASPRLHSRRSQSEVALPTAAADAHPAPAAPAPACSPPAAMSSAFRSGSALIPSKEEMRAAIAQAQAAQQHPIGPGHPLSAWSFWQEQQRQLQEQQRIAVQRPHSEAARAASLIVPSHEAPSEHSQPPPPPPPQPQLRTYPPIRGPIMSLSSLPPQYRRDSSASSSSSFSSASSSGLTSPPLSDGHRPQRGSQSTSVAAMIRAYERQRQIESMNVARGWDRQRPALVVGSFGQSSYQSSVSSPSSHSPHPDFAQPHSAPLVPHHLAGARFSPLLVDQPLRRSHGSLMHVDGLHDQRRRSAHTPTPELDADRLQGACPPWLSAQSLPYFSLRPPSASSCSYCHELAEKARAGAVAPGRARELSLSERSPEELSPQQQTLLLARSNGVGALMQAQQTVKPTILPNFIVTPAIYPLGHPLAPLPPPSAMQQIKEATAPNSPHLMHHHHHHHHLHGGERLGHGGAVDGLRLHREVEAFTSFVSRLSSARHSLLLSLMLRVRDCVLSLWPAAAVHSYGSFMTGLGLPSSDLDLVLLHVPLEPKAALQQLASVLQLHAWVRSLNAIDTARVPVIKVVGEVDGKQAVIDITFDQPSGHGESCGVAVLPSAHSGLASVDLLCHYVAVFPALRPLTLVLKQFLVERGLSSTYTGGLNSYCLVLMVVAFIQSRPDAYRHYAQQQRHVHEQIHAQRAYQRAIMEQLGIAVPDMPPVPPLSRPSSSSCPPTHSSMPPPVSPLPIPARHSFTLSAHSPAFQPSSALSSGGSLSLPQAPGGLLPRSMPSSPLPLPASPFPYEAAESPLLPPLPPCEADLGALLVELLTFYACEFDFTTMGIAVHPPPTMPHMPSPALDAVTLVEDGGGCFFHLAVSSATLVLSDPLYPLMANNVGKGPSTLHPMPLVLAFALAHFASLF